MKNNFKDFMLRTFTNLEMYPYLDDLFSNLDSFIDDFKSLKRPFLNITMPPRHLKSETVSIRLPAYLNEKFSDLNIGVFCINQDLANLFYRKFKEICPKNKIKNNIKYFGFGTGLGCRDFDLIIFDDLIRNNKERDSERYNEYLKEQIPYIVRRLNTPFKKPAGLINCHTRWSCEDQTGILMNNYQNKNWKTLKYQFITKLTERYTIEEILRTAHNYPSEIFKALFMQEPVK